LCGAPRENSKSFCGVGLSTGLKHFSLFQRVKIGASAKNSRPNFRAAKKRKMPRTGGIAEKPTGTLAAEANDYSSKADIELNVRG